MQYVKQTDYGFYCTYSDCTWELLDDIRDAAKKAIEHDLVHRANAFNRTLPSRTSPGEVASWESENRELKLDLIARDPGRTLAL